MNVVDYNIIQNRYNLFVCLFVSESSLLINHLVYQQQPHCSDLKSRFQVCLILEKHSLFLKLSIRVLFFFVM